MRALIVAGSPDCDAQHVLRLATEADLVVAVDRGADVCIEAAVRPDVLIGDMDSIAPETLERLEKDGVDVVRLEVAKDTSDLAEALGEAAVRGAERVVLTGVSGGRIDHTLAVLGAMTWESHLHPRISEPGLSAWLLAQDGRTGVGLLGTGSTVSVFAVDDGALAASSGLRWPLEGVALEPLESRGLSNVIESEPARVDRRAGVVLVVSPQVGDVPPAHEA